MFQLLQQADAAHVVVELQSDEARRLKDSSVMHSEDFISGGATPEWTKMIYCIFLDILDGGLFLTLSERMNWSWVSERGLTT